MWARQFARDEQPAFFVDGYTPEITVGVKPHSRGRGVGRMLLNALIGDAARRDIGLCLMSGTTIRRDASTSAIMWHPPRRKLRLADALASRALRADAMESITGGWLSFVKLIGFLAQHARGAGGSMT